MKKDIHPEYYNDAVIKCACGNTIKVGSTKKEVAVEICGACHPFFTGKEKIIDTAGRVEKFRARAESSKKEQDKIKKNKSVPKEKKGENKRPTKVN